MPSTVPPESPDGAPTQPDPGDVSPGAGDVSPGAGAGAARAAPADVDLVAPAERGSPIGRRVVLGMVGLAVAGVVVGKRLQSGITDVMAPVQAADPTGLTQLLPAGGGFRFYTITNSFPSIDPATYRLRVTGMVDRPLTLTLEDLKAMPPTNLVKDFQCVTGWRVAQVPWKGVLLSQILAAAGVQAAGKALRFHSFDQADTESLTLTQAARPDVIVAYEMLGGPVTSNHGGPVRLYVAPMYGYKSLKWMDGIEVTRAVVPGYWEQNGYDVDGWIGGSNGRDDKPVT